MKKLLAVLLSVLMVVSLAACGGGGNNEKTAYSFKVWAADNVTDLTKTQLQQFADEHPEYDLTFTVEAVGEGDAATSMITDVEAGADIFCFAQDQLARLVQANALAKPGTKASETITSENDAGAVAAATFDGSIYAYPLTSDNGYFMYYDTSVIPEEDLDDLSAILQDCIDAGRMFAFEGTSNAWYEAGVFFGTGCVSEWNMNGTDIVSYTDTFDSDNGLVAAKILREIVTSPAFMNSSGADAFTANPQAAVLVSGTWAYNDVAGALGSNLGATDLPSATVDGVTYHIGSFGGNKLMGVKPQTDAEKAAVASQIALYLTGEECQQERFDAVAWGPSNKNVAASDAVQANPALAALAKQGEFAVPQGQYPGAWWDIAKAIGSAIQEAGVSSTDDQLKAILKNYSDSLAALLTVDPEVARAFTVIGSFNDWSGDVAMTEDPAGTWTSEPIELEANAELKVRQGKSWDLSFGGAAGGQESDNYIVSEAGTYVVTLVYDESAGTATLTVTKQ